MDWTVEITKFILGGRELPVFYSNIFVLFVVVVIFFVIWLFNYAIYGGAIKELNNVEWIKPFTVIKYTVLIVCFLVVASIIFLGIDTVVSTITNYIIKI
ncbi:MAG: preprotein translocase subunit SecE [Candidatus Dojkabacteria bacterium]|nr:preprotein translocase subunit SecE [Candidatus Dojkabacteria bacterium]